MDFSKDRRLIEGGFPCHQVGAETQRERDTGKAPPTHRLHVWWARRPLTPSRAAILASILPADTDAGWFLKELGIQKKIVRLSGGDWVLRGPSAQLIRSENGEETLDFDERTLQALEKENSRRAESRKVIKALKSLPELRNHPVLERWEKESAPLKEPPTGKTLQVLTVAADPAHVKERIAFASSGSVVQNLGKSLKWDPEDLYGYDRAFTNSPKTSFETFTTLDMTAGGGSIPFESLRLGCNTIVNELNPVASVILEATLHYPARFGIGLIDDISLWGNRMLQKTEEIMAPVTPFSPLPPEEIAELKQHCSACPEAVSQFSVPEYDQTGLLYTRQVTCPHCGGEAPLLNTCWLSKAAGDLWGVAVVPDGRKKNGTVAFQTYRVTKGKGPRGENPDFATVKGGKGTCVHCGQGIEAEEIKRQARGESEFGRWKDRLYAVAAVRFQPKLDKSGRVQRFVTGARAGEIKTEKIRFFRPPNERDLKALEKAEKMLAENWDGWEDEDLIPTERFPQGNDMRPVIFGMERWCDLFTPRQLLGHLTLAEELNRLKPLILKELGIEKGKAVVTYLQFALDKGFDYNSKQTRWIPQRTQVSGTFGRHDFSLKWTFGEMIFSGPNSGAAWGLSQILDAYKGIAELLEPVHKSAKGNPSLMLLNGTAASMPSIGSKTVDVICFDPPYYNNVQYGELSDYFYVWQKRTLGDLYPDLFIRRLVNKEDEAVANPDRDGGEQEAKAEYERMMGEIFEEARRVLKDDGIMTMMFTHKSQEAWESLTQALIEKRWVISSTIPVESEFLNSQHLMDNASAASSIFISCRKGPDGEARQPSSWSFGGRGVQQQIREAVREGLEQFAPLRLNPVDEMVSCYGRALQVLSRSWPVYDGDEAVGPRRAMLEASGVVAEAQMERIAGGRFHLSDLSPEAAMAVLFLGLFGLKAFAYDEGLNLSRSMNIALEERTAGYTVNGRFIGVNRDVGAGRAAGAGAEETGFAAPLVRKGSKLRLALPEERDPRRMKSPQTEWDLLCGLILAYRTGAEVSARGYMERLARDKASVVKALLRVWTDRVGQEDLKKEGESILFGLAAF